MMNSTKPSTKFTRLLTITIVATITAEVLSGSTTLSRIQNLTLQLFLYGPAVILIRELSLRFNKGWATILLLGLAFGLTLEGLVLQSVFNPNFIGNNISFGRAIGVNWVWLAYMPPFHAFWAVSLPILLCNLFFLADKDEPWCSNTALIFTGIILLIVCTGFHFLFIKITKFNTTPVHLLLLTGCIGLIVMTAFRLPRRFLDIAASVTPKPSYITWLIAAVTFIAGVLWHFGFDTIFMASKPPVLLAILSAPLILIVYFTVIGKLITGGIISATARFGLVCGLLLSECLFGYFATAGNTTDHTAQLVFMILIVLMLIMLYSRVNRTLVFQNK